MGSLSDYTENKMLDHILGTAAYTPPSTVYVALCTADPTDAGTGATIVEPNSSHGYSRQAITFSAASSRVVTNNNTVTFGPNTTTNWGEVGYWAVLDTGTYGAGNVLAHGAFSVPKTVIVGKSPKIQTATLSITVNAGGCTNYVANKLLDFVFRYPTGTFAVPQKWIALCTATVSDGSTSVTEPGTGSYARVQHSAWDAAVAGASENIGIITFPVPTANWGDITAAAIADASTAGNILFYDNGLNETVLQDDEVSYADGTFDISLG